MTIDPSKLHHYKERDTQKEDNLRAKIKNTVLRTFEFNEKTEEAQLDTTFRSASHIATKSYQPLALELANLAALETSVGLSGDLFTLAKALKDLNEDQWNSGDLCFTFKNAMKINLPEEEKIFKNPTKNNFKDLTISR